MGPSTRFEDETSPPVHVAVRPLASPLPIGLLALTVGSAVLSGSQLHWIGLAHTPMVGWCLLGFVVPLQFTAFVFAVLAHDEGAATALAVLSGTWAATGIVTVVSPPGSTGPTLGILLCAAAGALLVPCAVTATTKPLIAAVLAMIGARFAMSGVYELAPSSSVEAAAGVLGIATSCLAWYAAAAFALEDAFGRTIVPTLRRQQFPPESAAGHPGVVASEAGVRARL